MQGFYNYLTFAFRPFNSNRQLADGSKYIFSLKEGLLYSFVVQVFISLFFVILLPLFDKFEFTVPDMFGNMVTTTIVNIIYGLNTVSALHEINNSGILKGILIWLLIFPFQRIIFYYITKFVAIIFSRYFETDVSKAKEVANATLASDAYLIIPIAGVYFAQLMYLVTFYAALIKNAKFSWGAAFLTIFAPLLMVFILLCTLTSVLGILYS